MPRVLLDTRAKHWDQNPYVSLLASSIQPDFAPVGFSWRTAIVGRYDLVHVHWPEYLLRMDRRALRVAARVLFTIWLLRLLACQVPVVRTSHDRVPFVPVGLVDRVLLSALARLTRLTIYLVDPAIDGSIPVISRRSVVIPHGDYGPWLDSVPAARPDAEPGRMLCFGILRPYKNFESVMGAVHASSHAHLRLRVMGSAPDSTYLQVLTRHASAEPERIQLRPGRVADDVLVQEICRADMVVVPYDDLYNSGVIFLAASLGTPVLLKDGLLSRALRDEFGPAFVRLFRGQLDAGQLERALDASTSSPAPRHPFTSPSREWSCVGKLHGEAYRDARRRADS